jgi:PIN domain nuclease of toxin-antitoxin system
MKYLLDTHAFLWFVMDDKRLSTEARFLIKDSKNEIFFSAATAWEMAIKVRLNRLKIKGNLEPFIMEQLSANNIVPLSITVSHSLYTERLPQIHKDPFDRLIIAQSIVENLQLITKDQDIRKYNLKVVW